MQNVVISIADIIDRIKQVSEAPNDAQVARLLQVPPKKLAVWKLRNTIPLEELTTFCKQHGCNLGWLLTGEKTDAVAEPAVRYSVDLDKVRGKEKNMHRLAAKLARIIEEGDPKKMKAVEAQLDLLDPGEKKA